ncbi:MAG: hypothetical protein COB37_11355 [Kordiimonadales bacterium]|nr:MAG: hypothetical protein COB37_11355 [Kordiimonadales bacterium]
MDQLLTYLDLAGVFVFAISGALAAARKDMDLFGIGVLALMPAVGGGTLRDLVLDVPVFWVAGNASLWAALAAAVLVFLFAGRVASRKTWLVWADAAGLALFSVVGAEKALAASDSAIVAVTLGVATAVAGGIIRDVICNEIPLVLKQEVYATAAFAGAGSFCLLSYAGVDGSVSLWGAIAIAFTIRAAAILRGWKLPKALR